MKKETLFSLAIMGVIPLLAFSIESRKEIGKRDNWTCQVCGKKFQDGWLVDAAHYDHDKTKENYNNPKNGRILCLDDHLKEHEAKGDFLSVELIRRRLLNSNGGKR